MKRSTFGWTVACTALVLGLAMLPAHALEADGRAGLIVGSGPFYGAMLDAPLGPVRVRGEAASLHGTLGWGAGLEWPWALPTGTLGPLLGVAQPPSPRACPGSCGSPADTIGPGRFGALLGLTYRWSDGPWRLALTPSVAVIPRDPIPIFDVGWQAQPPAIDPTATWMVGPPWLEVGYRVTPWLDVALRTSSLPLAVSWRFGGTQPKQEPPP